MKKDWTYKKLGEVCETTSGGTPSKSKMEYYENGDIPWLRSGELSNGEIYSTELCITQKGLDNSSAKIIPAGTVSIAMYGATVGEVGIIKKPMCTNQAICNILPNEQFIPNFIRYVLVAYKPKFISLATGGAQPNISQNIIKNTSIPIPPLAIQRSIVAELDLHHSVIEKKQEQLRALDNLAQSLFYQMFGDPITNPMGWEIKKLGEVAKFINGDRGINYPSAKDFVNEGVPFINAGHLQQGKVDFSSMNYITDTKFDKLHAGKITKNDILFCLRGSLGKYAIVDFDQKGAIASSLVIIRSEKCVIPLYICNYLKSEVVKEYIEKANNGSSQPNLSANSVSAFSLPLPPLSLQQSFAAKVSAIEEQKRSISQSIKDVESLLAQRMDYYFG